MFDVIIAEKMDSSTGKEISTFEPLLNNLSEIYPDLMCKWFRRTKSSCEGPEGVNGIFLLNFSLGK